MFGIKSQHTLQAVLGNYLLGRLEEPEKTAVEEHLLLCEACRQELDEQEFGYLVRESSRRIRSREEAAAMRLRRHPRLAWPWALAAGLAAVLFLSRPSVTTTYSDVELQTMRGAPGTARAPAGHPLRLAIDLTELPARPTLKLELVTAVGAPVFQASQTVTGDTLVVVIDRKLTPGIYWARLYDPDSRLLREFGLRVE